MSDYLDETFGRVTECLQPFAWDPRTKSCSPTLLYSLNGVVIKILNPEYAERTLQHVGLTTLEQLALHERSALKASNAVPGARHHIAQLLPECDVRDTLIRAGVAAEDCNHLLPLIVATHRLSGTPLGHYDSRNHKHVYSPQALRHLTAEAFEVALAELEEFVQDMNAAGIFHNDLAPQNLLLANNSKKLTIAIVDFGVAFIDSYTSWEQPSVLHINHWYLKHLQDGIPALRDRAGHLRASGVSLDLIDLNTHRHNIGTHLRRQ